MHFIVFNHEHACACNFICEPVVSARLQRDSCASGDNAHGVLNGEHRGAELVQATADLFQHCILGRLFAQLATPLLDTDGEREDFCAAQETVRRYMFSTSFAHKRQKAC